MTYLIGAALLVLMFAGIACLVHVVRLGIDASCPDEEGRG